MSAHPVPTSLSGTSVTLAREERWWQLTQAIGAMGREMSVDGRLQQTAVAAAATARGRYAVLVVYDPVHRYAEKVVYSATDPAGIVATRELLQRHRTNDSEPDGTGLRGEVLTVPIRTDAGPYGTLYLLDPLDRDTFTTEDYALVASLAETIGVGVDCATAFEQSERRGDWLSASTAVSQQLLTFSAGLLGVAQDICDHVLRLTQARTATLDLEDPHNPDRLETHVVAGTKADELLAATYLIAGSIAETALQNQTAQLHVPPHLTCSHTARILHHNQEAPLGAVLVVPINAPHRGVVVASRGADQPAFTDADLQMAATFASQASLALELVEARRQQENIRLQLERDRISQRLQDNVIQRLFSIGLQVVALNGLTDNRHIRTRLHDVVTDLDETIREVRHSLLAE